MGILNKLPDPQDKATLSWLLNSKGCDFLKALQPVNSCPSCPSCPWPCAQVPEDQAGTFLLPLADLPHRGCPEHGQVSEPVPWDRFLQWGHPFLECQHVEAHLEFQCLREPLAFTAEEGTVPCAFPVSQEAFTPILSFLSGLWARIREGRESILGAEGEMETYWSVCVG